MIIIFGFSFSSFFVFLFLCKSILEALNQVERSNLSEILKRHVYKEKTQLIKKGEKVRIFFEKQTHWKHSKTIDFAIILFKFIYIYL